MRKFPVFIALLFSINYLLSQNYADSASHYSTEFQKITEARGTNLWGIKIGSPVIFIDKEKGLAYLSESTLSDQEKKYKDIYILPLDSTMTKSIPLVEWNNRTWVVVSFPYKYSHKELLEFMAHESFHAIQSELQIPMSSPSLPHLSTIKGRTLMQVELMELFRALEEQETDLRKKHLKNALTLRAHRYAILPDARSIEKRAEMNEGLAEYSGVTYAGYTKEERLGIYKKSIKLLESLQSEGAYPYTSGSLYAFLNDEKDDTWRKLIPERSISEISQLIYDIKLEKNTEQRSKEILEFSEYAHISSLFTLNTSEGLKRLFTNNRLILPSKGSSFQLRSNLVVSIPGEGTVYNNITISNTWGDLYVEESGRVLIKEGEIVLNTNSVVKESYNLRGIGWQLQINKAWEVRKNGNNQYLQESIRD